MANLNINNNYLETLVGASADAQSNLYLTTISGGFLKDSVTQALKVRCDNFTPPRTSQGKYDVKFITAKIPRPNGKVEVVRNFALDFRVDANYVAYKALLDQQGKTFVPTKSFALSDIKAAIDRGDLFEVKVEVMKEGMLDENPESMLLNRFKNCWITQINPIRYNPATSEPIIVSVTFGFVEMQDIQTGF